MLRTSARWFERTPSRFYSVLLLLPLLTIPLTMLLALLSEIGPPALHIDPAEGTYLHDARWPLLFGPGLLNLFPWLLLLPPARLTLPARPHAQLAGLLGALRLLAPIILWAVLAPPPNRTACPNLQPCALGPLLWSIGASLALWIVTLLCWVVAIARE